MVKNLVHTFILIFILVAGNVCYGQVFLRNSGDCLLLTNIPQPDFIRIRKYKKNNQEQYKKLVQKAALKHNLSFELIDAVIAAESGYNPRAISCKGAQGLMQLMPGTADALKVNNAFDPEENIDAGARYLKAMIDRYGSVELALAAYNAGPKAVDKYRDIPPYKETQGYVKKIKAKLNPNDSINSRKKAPAPPKNGIKVKKDNKGNIVISN
jgi:soluble lytic murein transglycosylase-like protein